MRNRLQKSDREEFIIDLSQPPGAVELQKERFGAKYKDFESFGFELDADNVLRRVEDNLGELHGGACLEWGYRF